jgi:hypothetical protein
MSYSVKSHSPEGTYYHARLAADTSVIINNYSPQFFILADSIHRTDSSTGSGLTLLAYYRHLEQDALLLKYDDS